MIKIAAQFKKDSRELNGLSAIEEELLAYPHNDWYIVARVINKRTSVEHVDGDTKSVTVNLVHIEPLSGDAEQTVRELLNSAYKTRTGNATPTPQDTLPFGEGEEGPVSERPKDEWIAPEAK